MTPEAILIKIGEDTMALRGIKPKERKKRLKLFIYGQSGVGKTLTSISFPKCYFVDTEDGASYTQYISMLEKNEGAAWFNTDFDELIKEVKSLLTVKHDYQTLVIDSLTILYNDLLHVCESRYGTDFGKHSVEAGKRVKHLINLLFKLDMSVIVTAQSKVEYGHNMAVLGNTYDCYKKLDYMFDIVMEVQMRGKERVGIIKKSRIESFPLGEAIPFNYEEIARRYGKEIIEQDTIPIELASEDQVLEIKRLIEILHVPKEYQEKLLKKEDASDFEYLTKEYMKKCIEHLKSKIQGE